MKISNLIKQLQEIQAASGDLEVSLHTGWEGHEHLHISDITVLDGDYVQETGGTTTGKHVLISY